MNKNIKLFHIITCFTLLTASLALTGCQHDYDMIKEKQTMERKTNIITNISIADLYPGQPNMSLAIEKSIIDDDKEEEAYLGLEYKYLSLLNSYLIKNGGLNRYQKLLDDSGFNYPVADKDIYYERGSFGRKNIAIRNRAFIERLSKADVDMLKTIPDADLIEYSEKLDMFVSRTWKELVNVVLEEGKTDPYSIVYDVDAVNKISAMSNSLVFELIYNLEYENGKMNDSTEAKYKKACEVAELMEKQLGNELGHDVTVLIKVR